MRQAIWVFSALLFVQGCAMIQAPRQRAADLAIMDALIIEPASEEPPSRQDIVVMDGRILAIGEDIADDFKSAEIYDASGRFLIPGLADMHSHFGNGIFPGDVDDTKAVLARHLYFGNTTILNLGSAQGWPAKIDELRDAAASGALKSPRLLAVGALITVPGSHPTTTIFSPDLQKKIADIVAARGVKEVIDLSPLRGISLVSTPDQMTREVIRVGDWGAEAIKIVVESGPDGFGDDHPQMGADLIRAATTAARPYGVPVICHISSLDEVEACMANGATAIAHSVGATEANLPADYERRMVDGGLVVIPTASMFEGWQRYAEDPALLDQPALVSLLSDHERALFGSAGMRNAFLRDGGWSEGVRLLSEHLARFHDAGGIIIAGTDTGNPYRFAGFALHEELAFYVRAAGLTPREALQTATTNAARFVNAQGAWGTIAPGAAADFVVLEKNPLNDIANTRSIVDVIKAGRVIDRKALPVK